MLKFVNRVTFDVPTDIWHSSVLLFLVQVDNSRCQISGEDLEFLGVSSPGYMPRIISGSHLGLPEEASYGTKRWCEFASFPC